MADFTPNVQSPSPQGSTIVDKPSLFQSIADAAKGLSLREKAMIVAILFIGIILVLVLLILSPANDRLIAAESENSALRSEQINAELNIASMTSYQTRLEEAQANQAVAIGKYQAMMLPEDIDRMMTSMLEGCGFTAGTLILAPATTEEVGSFVPSAPTWVMPNAVESAPSGAEEGAEATPAAGSQEGASESDGAFVPDGYPEEDHSSLANSTGSSQVQVFTVQVSVIGYDESFHALLDKILPQTWIKIMSTTYTPPSSSYYEESYVPQAFSITFKIYVHPSATLKSL